MPEKESSSTETNSEELRGKTTFDKIFLSGVENFKSILKGAGIPVEDLDNGKRLTEKKIDELLESLDSGINPDTQNN
ncbi:MAG TPA: hypothetical protein ENI70_00675 [Candidatus Peregrinibacteria bacterium]|nr:hypothetical protein [Candidatus Peregrinibacteria bacterium]